MQSSAALSLVPGALAGSVAFVRATGMPGVDGGIVRSSIACAMVICRAAVLVSRGVPVDDHLFTVLRVWPWFEPVPVAPVFRRMPVRAWISVGGAAAEAGMPGKGSEPPFRAVRSEAE